MQLLCIILHVLTRDLGTSVMKKVKMVSVFSCSALPFDIWRRGRPRIPWLGRLIRNEMGRQGLLYYMSIV
jgi:hypothetical protein